MQRLWDTVFAAVAAGLLVGSLILPGCTGANTVAASASQVNNRSFTFPNGIIFHPALSNIPTTLTFFNQARTFRLQATVQEVTRQATGTTTFGSCALTIGFTVTPSTVGGGSDFPVGQGPPPGTTITLNPCEIDLDDATLMVSNGSLTATSLPAVAATDVPGI